MERRRATRRIPGPNEPIRRLRLRTGRDVDVLDISDAGAHVEGAVRLLPGTHADAHVVSPDGRVVVRARVVRSIVCSLQPDGVRYRAALAFETLIDTRPPGHGVPDPMGGSADRSGTTYPSSSEPRPRHGGNPVVAS